MGHHELLGGLVPQLGAGGVPEAGRLGLVGVRVVLSSLPIVLTSAKSRM
jgi:hypothetical protein